MHSIFSTTVLEGVGVVFQMKRYVGAIGAKNTWTLIRVPRSFGKAGVYFYRNIHGFRSI